MLEHDIQSESSPTTTRRKPSKRIDASSIFVALLVVAAGAGLYYMHWRTAETLKLIRGADADAASVDTFLSGGQANLAMLGKSIRETRATVAQLTRTAMPVPASSIFDTRDPFTFESLEPKDAPVLPQAPSNSARELNKARLLTQARTLQVQSIMFGSAKRSCLINGKLYFEKQSCGEFIIASITPDAVYIQSGELRFELRLRK